ncbi:MAG: tetratricopeptide repeat protein, partial [Aureispira sp.]|nr:tetratricopeptide repeat protein [Aureispira sp.]
DYPNALNYFNQAIAKDSLFAYAYNNKGYVLIQEGNYSQALEAVQKSLNLDNNNAYAYRNMAICYANMGDKTASCEALVVAGKVEYGLRIKEELEDLKVAYCQ